MITTMVKRLHCGGSVMSIIRVGAVLVDNRGGGFDKFRPEAELSDSIEVTPYSLS